MPERDCKTKFILEKNADSVIGSYRQNFFCVIPLHCKPLTGTIDYVVIKSMDHNVFVGSSLE